MSIDWSFEAKIVPTIVGLGVKRAAGNRLSVERCRVLEHA
jgi:hypothetical protein